MTLPDEPALRHLGRKALRHCVKHLPEVRHEEIINPDDYIISSYSPRCGRLRLAAADATATVRITARRLISWYLLLTRSRLLVDKYPELIFWIPFVQALFPDARFVMVMRSPTKVIVSIAGRSDRRGVGEANWWGVDDRKRRVLWNEAVAEDPGLAWITEVINHKAATDAERAAVEWLATVTEALRLRRINVPFTVLAYEDLMADPVNSMERLLATCELPSSGRVVKFARRQVRADPATPSLWVCPDPPRRSHGGIGRGTPDGMRVLVIHKAWRAVGGVEEHMFQVVRFLSSVATTWSVLDGARGQSSHLRPLLPRQCRLPKGVGGEPDLGHGTSSARAGYRAPARSAARYRAGRRRLRPARVLPAWHDRAASAAPEGRADSAVPSRLQAQLPELPALRRPHPPDLHHVLRPPARVPVGPGGPPMLGRLGVRRNGADSRGHHHPAGPCIPLRGRGARHQPTATTWCDPCWRPPSRIRILPHPVVLPNTLPAREPGQCALYVGRLVPEKGVHLLIRAAAQNRVPVRIVGDGRSTGELQDLRDQLDAPVTFVGALDRAGVEQERQQAAMLVVPSVWHETWGLVINEAIANRLPVVVSAVGVLPDILGQGRGVLVPPGDAEALAEGMTRLLVDPCQSEKVANRAWRFAATELTHAQWVSRLEAAFAR